MFAKNLKIHRIAFIILIFSFMKKTLAVLIAVPLVLTSCFYDRETPKNPETPSTDTAMTTTASGESVMSTASTGASVSLVKKEIVGTGDTVAVDYVGTLEDGTVFDSSLEVFAKKMKNYQADSGRKYEPLSFTVGAGQMIP